MSDKRLTTKYWTDPPNNCTEERGGSTDRQIPR